MIASDEDSSSNGDVFYQLINNEGANSPFVLISSIGSLTVQQELDRETTAQYTVSCTSLTSLYSTTGGAIHYGMK